jgi:hypothetical protein
MMAVRDPLLRAVHDVVLAIGGLLGSAVDTGHVRSTLGLRNSEADTRLAA